MVTGYGGEDVLQLSEIKMPTPRDSQLLVKVHATSVNPIDTWVRRGYGRELFETYRKPPFVLGRDFAGEVVDVGNNVWNYKVASKYCS